MSDHIDSGASFLRVIKTVTNEDHDAEAIAFLDKTVAETLSAINASVPAEKRMVVAYYQGAILGLKIAAARNRQAAEAAAHEAGIDIHTGEKTKSNGVRWN